MPPEDVADLVVAAADLEEDVADFSKDLLREWSKSRHSHTHAKAKSLQLLKARGFPCWLA